MKVLIIGSGGREHALAWKISQSKNVSKIYAAPGNPGIGEVAKLININASEEILSFAKNEKIDLTVVGPEVPLVQGIVDIFEAEHLRIFGPNKKCAMLEGSKSYAKEFMKKYNIPTAKFMVFENINDAKKNIAAFGFPVVIKADGLAAGKGVIIAQNKIEAYFALEMMMDKYKFSDAGKKIVVEEHLKGVEASILCFVDGKTILPMESAKDYKKAQNGDAGLNTGGMGAYSPNANYTPHILAEVKKTILNPLIQGLNRENLDYKGVLYIGLMICKDSINVLEFNVRFGDPETQVLLPRLQNDLVEVMESVIDQKLDKTQLCWIKKQSLCVVLTSGGYPENYQTGKIINGLSNIEDELIFHAGSTTQDGIIKTNGGRVLNVVAVEDTIILAKNRVYETISKISFDDMFFRTDIGS